MMWGITWSNAWACGEGWCHIQSIGTFLFELLYPTVLLCFCLRLSHDTSQFHLDFFWTYPLFRSRLFSFYIFVNLLLFLLLLSFRFLTLWLEETGYGFSFLKLLILVLWLSIWSIPKDIVCPRTMCIVLLVTKSFVSNSFSVRMIDDVTENDKLESSAIFVSPSISLFKSVDICFVYLDAGMLFAYIFILSSSVSLLCDTGHGTQDFMHAKWVLCPTQPFLHLFDELDPFIFFTHL